MAQHFIAVLSHYGNGTRIGWIYSEEEKLNGDKIKLFMTRFKRKCGDLQLGIHNLTTDTVDVESVLEKDQFFEDVIFMSDMEQFISMAAADKELTGYDVAKFILTIMPTSHLKLQKLLYLAYADFLENTGVKLFKDQFVAFKYGPVVLDVFHKLKGYKAEVIEIEEDDVLLLPGKLAATPSLMKILASEHGIPAFSHIAKVILEYKDCTAHELVDLTHKEGGPWQRVYKQGENVVIPTDTISVYHSVISKNDKQTALTY